MLRLGRKTAYEFIDHGRRQARKLRARFVLHPLGER